MGLRRLRHFPGRRLVSCRCGGVAFLFARLPVPPGTGQSRCHTARRCVNEPGRPLHRPSRLPRCSAALPDLLSHAVRCMPDSPARAIGKAPAAHDGACTCRMRDPTTNTDSIPDSAHCARTPPLPEAVRPKPSPPRWYQTAEPQTPDNRPHSSRKGYSRACSCFSSTEVMRFASRHRYATPLPCPRSSVPSTPPPVATSLLLPPFSWV